MLSTCVQHADGQKVDFDRRTAMYQISIKTADTNPYQRVPGRPTINLALQGYARRKDSISATRQLINVVAASRKSERAAGRPGARQTYEPDRPSIAEQDCSEG